VIFQMNLSVFSLFPCEDLITMERRDISKNEEGCLFQYLFNQALEKQPPAECISLPAFEKYETEGEEMYFGVDDPTVRPQQKQDFELIENGEFFTASAFGRMKEEPKEPVLREMHKVQRVEKNRIGALSRGVEAAVEQKPVESGKAADVKESFASSKAAEGIGISDTGDKKIKPEAAAGVKPGPIDKKGMKDLPAAAPVQENLQKVEITKSEKSEPYNQIGQEILKRVENKKPVVFTMQLEPKDLGKIEVRLKINEGRLVIDIMAANSKTQALLAGQADKLIHSMGLQNVQVENVQIERLGDYQNADRQEGFSAMNNGETDSPGKRHSNQSQGGKGGSLNPVETVQDEAGDPEKARSSFTKMDYLI
jgi:hypothetical protein